MRRLSKKQLKELFITIVSETDAKCSEANPFIFQKGNFKCYVFIKNISPAYYANYPDNSRVQLPESDRFKEVIDSELDFLILGYDQNNEVFATWNPSLIKDRLNAKRNVSVYSRFSWQSSIPSGEFVEHNLGNEEKILLFKKELLNEYFDRYREFFDLPNINIARNSFERAEFGFDIKEIRKIIDPLLKDHKVLEAVSILKNLLKNEPEYQELSFKDYYKIVNEIYTDLNP
jgi:hypothetical protein